VDVDVRPYEGDPRDFLTAVDLSFGERLRDEDAKVFAARFEADRAIAAYDGERIVGTAAIFSFDLTIPGGSLPAAGVTAVGVHPTHRRRGVLRRMMRAQLDGVRERGEPFAILWASESNIYQRFGYGLSTLRTRMRIERDRSAFRHPHQPAGTIRFVEVDQARKSFPPIYEVLRPVRPGFFSRSPAFWDLEVFHDPEHWRQGAGPAWYVVHEVAGEADGYARYRIKDQWDDIGPRSQLQISEMMATNPAAHLDLWRYLLDIDLIGHIEAWNVAPDDPLILAAIEPRRLGIGVGDAMWLRIVDLPSALAGRRYATDGRIVLEVADEFCPWNEGRWLLNVEDGVPYAELTTDAPDVRCDITDVAAAYLGGFSFIQLADAARATELTPGALERADALFHTARPPWCPRVF
jgi:predicted acetyltransferase